MKPEKLHDQLAMSVDLVDFASKSKAHRLTDENGNVSRVWPVWAYDITQEAFHLQVTRRVHVESLC